MNKYQLSVYSAAGKIVSYGYKSKKKNKLDMKNKAENFNRS